METFKKYNPNFDPYVKEMEECETGQYYEVSEVEEALRSTSPNNERDAIPPS